MWTEVKKGVAKLVARIAAKHEAKWNVSDGSGFSGTNLHRGIMCQVLFSYHGQDIRLLKSAKLD